MGILEDTDDFRKFVFKEDTSFIPDKDDLGIPREKYT